MPNVTSVRERDRLRNGEGQKKMRRNVKFRWVVPVGLKFVGI